MIKLTFKKLAEVLKCSSPVNGEFLGVSTDTRSLQSGNLFVALSGENFDGHDFLLDAKAKGAVGAIVSKGVKIDLPLFNVLDTVKSLGYLSKFWRGQFDLPLIAVTGSHGKTTVKNMIASIFNQVCEGKMEQYLSSNKSYNNHIGVPLTLFKLSKGHRYGVLELGMNHFGELSYLSKLVKPTIALIINAFNSHLSGVGDIHGVVQAKGEIFSGLVRAGTAILNKDDPNFHVWKSMVGKNQNLLSFSMATSADCYAKNIVLRENSTMFSLRTLNKEVTISLPLSGKHNVANAVAAATAAIGFGISLNHIKAGLNSVKSENQRLNFYNLNEGVILIDDSYNAAPASTKAAVDVLSLQSKRKILVLADMKELGENEVLFHQEIGKYAQEKGIDILLTFGELAKYTSTSFGKKGKNFETKSDLSLYLKQLIKEGDCILVKGSNSMNMKEVVNDILSNEL